MKTASTFRLVLFLALFASNVVAHADDFKLETGFTSLFNGRDLTGWGFQVEKFDGKNDSSDGRYSGKDGILTVHPHTPRVVEVLWRTDSFPKNFMLKLEFRAETNADSGLFMGSEQLQVRDYLIAGPYTKLKQYKAQDWNEIIVIAKDGVAYCTCNGEVLEKAMKIPASGSIGLEADRGQMEYRRIRIKEL